MSEEYKPTPEEIIDAESNLSNTQEILSKTREQDYNRLSPEEIELLKLCDLRTISVKNRETIYGTINGHEIGASHTSGIGREYTTWTIDGIEISDSLAQKLFEKYRRIARFQGGSYKEKPENLAKINSAGEIGQEILDL